GRLFARAPSDHAAPFERQKIDVHADPLQHVGRNLRLGEDRRYRRGGKDEDLLALITGGNQILLDLVQVLGPAGDLDADIARHRRPRYKQADIGLNEVRFGAGNSRHDLLLVHRREHDAPDRGVVERREQVVETQAADFAGAVFDGDHEVFVAL